MVAPLIVISTVEYRMSDSSDLVRHLVLIVALVILMALLVLVLGWPAMGVWSGHHMWGSAGTSWLLVWLVGILLLIGGLYIVVRLHRQSVGGDEDQAMEALRLAYAQGEFSYEEFEERRERLEQEE